MNEGGSTDFFRRVGGEVMKRKQYALEGEDGVAARLQAMHGSRPSSEDSPERQPVGFTPALVATSIRGLSKT